MERRGDLGRFLISRYREIKIIGRRLPTKSHHEVILLKSGIFAVNVSFTMTAKARENQNDFTATLKAIKMTSKAIKMTSKAVEMTSEAIKMAPQAIEMSSL